MAVLESLNMGVKRLFWKIRMAVIGTEVTVVESLDMVERFFGKSE